MSKQSEAVAEIALEIPAQLSSAALLCALNRAYQAGFTHGFESSTKHRDQIDSMIASFFREVAP